MSYRELELMLANRGVDVTHTTLFRWTQTYEPEIRKRTDPISGETQERSWAVVNRRGKLFSTLTLPSEEKEREHEARKKLHGPAQSRAARQDRPAE
ncbi:hypothetical protein [Roseomonas chloroacetimidivorans]|uniref:hypothetical protein n=1 Tax=Roseomonas chloroacetimidivorans TaxID=1766656 RepID=UPI003C72234B